MRKTLEQDNIENEYGLKALLLMMTILATAIFLYGCGPSIDSKDPTKRKAALGKITDQTILTKIATEDTDSNVRLAAAEKLTNQIILAKIAAEDTDSNVRLTTAGKLTNQTALLKVVTDGNNEDVRKAVFARLTDKKLFQKLAIESTHEDVRALAAVKLTDSTGLKYHIWSTSEGPFIRDAGSQFLSVPIYYVCQGDPIPFVTSFGLIRNQSGLYWSDAIILKWDSDEGTHKTAGNTTSGETTVLHIDFMRNYSGKGFALISLCDGANNHKISNEIMVPVELN